MRRWAVGILLMATLGAAPTRAAEPTASSQPSEAVRQKRALKDRTFRLFYFLITDIQKRKNLSMSGPEWKKLLHLPHDVTQKLDQLGLFEKSDALLTDDKLAKLTPLEIALYEYYLMARLKNPVYLNMEKDIDRQEMYRQYAPYLLKDRPAFESIAYHEAFVSLEVHAGMRPPPVVAAKPAPKPSASPTPVAAAPPAPPPPDDDSAALLWTSLTAGALLLVVAAGYFYSRRHDRSGAAAG